MAREYSPMPALLRLHTPGGSYIVINAAHVVSAVPSDPDGSNAGGSTLEMSTGTKIEITKSADDFWDFM